MTFLPPTPEKFCDWLAHYGASEFAKSNVTTPDKAVTRVASSEEGGIDVIVILRKRVRATLQYDERGNAFIGPPPVETPPSPLLPKGDRENDLVAEPVKSDSLLDSLSDVELAALKAASKKPATVKALAKIAKYAYSSHFCNAVRRLIDLNLLRRVSRGVVLAQTAD